MIKVRTINLGPGSGLLKRSSSDVDRVFKNKKTMFRY